MERYTIIQSDDSRITIWLCNEYPVAKTSILGLYLFTNGRF